MCFTQYDICLFITRSGHSRMLFECCRFSLLYKNVLKVETDGVMLRDIGRTFTRISILC